MTTTQIEKICLSEQCPALPIILDNISSVMAPVTVSSALVFEGALDLPRFLDSLRFVATQCPWLVCQYNKDENVTAAVPRTSEDAPFGFFHCEVVRSPEADCYDDENRCTLDAFSALPMITVHEKMLRPDLALFSVQDLPVATFKVNIFRRHFVVGYRLNHAFYDQSSIVYLFEYLGAIYSALKTGEESKIAPPRFHPRVHLAKDLAPFTSEDEFVAATPKLYRSDAMTALNMGIPINVEVEFVADKVQAFKEEHGVSTNDVLNGIVLKTLETYHAKKDQQMEEAKDIRLLFARNMRNSFGLGPEITGDYVRIDGLSINPSQCTTNSLAALAKMSRQEVQTNLQQTFPLECHWLESFPKFRAGIPNSDFLTDPKAAVVTNWSSFPYEKINFDDASLTELFMENAPYLTGLGAFARMAFRGTGSERRLYSVVSSQHDGFAEVLEDVANTSGLVICKRNSAALIPDVFNFKTEQDQ